MFFFIAGPVLPGQSSSETPPSILHPPHHAALAAYVAGRVSAIGEIGLTWLGVALG